MLKSLGRSERCVIIDDRASSVFIETGLLFGSLLTAAVASSNVSQGSSLATVVGAPVKDFRSSGSSPTFQASPPATTGKSS